MIEPALCMLAFQLGVTILYLSATRGCSILFHVIRV
jgi:hypothetical protein